MCRTIMSAGARRGAMMATIRCDHPDIEAFIAAKRDPLPSAQFQFVRAGDRCLHGRGKGRCALDPELCRQDYRIISARGLWDQIMQSTYDYAEPGVIFIDRINAQNNLGYCETIHCTNPCGEQPLPQLWRLPARFDQSHALCEISF